MPGECPVCKQPFREGDLVKPQKTCMVKKGKKSGRLIVGPVSDVEVYVHENCELQFLDRRFNNEVLESIRTMVADQLYNEWRETELEELKLEAWDAVSDELKNTCASCFEEIQMIQEEINTPDSPPPPPPSALPWSQNGR